VSERDATEDALHDAAHDAFMQFWRAGHAAEALWLAYCAAQARYEQRLCASRPTVVLVELAQASKWTWEE